MLSRMRLPTPAWRYPTTGCTSAALDGRERTQLQPGGKGSAELGGAVQVNTASADLLRDGPEPSPDLGEGPHARGHGEVDFEAKRTFVQREGTGAVIRGSSILEGSHERH